jgi:uncharacterized protein YdeI (YjbR/CyaY-like superfamily)
LRSSLAGPNLPLGFVMGKRTMLDVTRRDEWRAWLEKHCESETEVWLVFFKTHTGRPHIVYEEAVEEALCFGWIDSIVRRLDDARYARKFTPRTSTSSWSASNRGRLRKLIREGRMTPAGLAKITDAGTVGQGVAERREGESREEPALPPAMMRELRANTEAWKCFSRLAPSYRRNYLRWVMSAKKDETRLRRLREAIGLLAQNRKLGLK